MCVVQAIVFSKKYPFQACEYENLEMLISEVCRDRVSGISIPNSVKVSMASPWNSNEKTPAFCTHKYRQPLLSEEIPQVQAESRTQGIF